MDDNALRAYLGDAYADTTEEQRAAILGAAEVIEQRWSDPDLTGHREAAMSAATQVALRDATLAGIAQEWHRAREAERLAMAALTGALIATREIDPTESEQGLADRAGVARMTVRKALGK